jgi:hypothetical protein
MKPELIFTWLVTFFVVVASWVLSGSPARSYKLGAPVKLQVNELISIKTHLGFDHYSLRFCKARDPPVLASCLESR